MDCKGDPCVCASGVFRASDLERIAKPTDPDVADLSRAVKLAHELGELLADVRRRRGHEYAQQVRDVVEEQLDGR